jgi:hypothetical protein
MKRSGRENWLRDVHARQRNLVFPETVANESTFWRNIIAGKKKLHASQLIGIGLIYLTLAAVFYGLISSQMRTSGIQGTLWDRIIGNFGGWIIVFGVAALLLLVGQVIRRYSRLSRKSPRLPRRS